MKTIYLDNAASTPLRTEVFEAMLPHLEHTYGNPSSIHHKGREAYTLLENARRNVASALHVKPSEIIFTSSGTEANNLALFGVLHAYGAQKGHVLISAIEHPSILKAGEQLTNEGFMVEYLPVNHDGQISVSETLAHIRPDTVLISVMLANNEIGTIQPIGELSQAIREKFKTGARPLLHTDACQATGQLTVLPDILGVDLMTLNSAKVYGPKGVGMLYVHEGVPLSPLHVGGNQESDRRAGTENIPNIIGFSVALKLALEEQEQQTTSLTTLRNSFLATLQEKIPHMLLNGHPTERLPNNIHVSIPYIEGESLVLLLDTHGVCASTGSACNAHNLLPSHVLRAIGQSAEIIHGSLRLTLGRMTTMEDLVYTAETLASCVKRLEAMSPLPLHL